MSLQLIQYQKEYLATHHPSKTITKKVIKAGWSMVLSIWEFRNETLHKTENIEHLQGSEILEEVVVKEWEYGLGNLPIHDFTNLFRLKKDELIKKSTQSKKDWLLTVKLGRKLHKDNRVAEDEFDTNEALRDWIGLPKLSNKKNSHQTKSKRKKKKKKKKKKSKR